MPTFLPTSQIFGQETEKPDTKAGPKEVWFRKVLLKTYIE